MTRHHLLIAAALCAMPFTVRAQATPAPVLACFVPKSGTMYVVGQPGAPDKCRSTDHVLLQWNAVGPAGPTGAAGPAGAPGPQGPPGTATLTGSSTLSALQYVVTEYTVGTPSPPTEVIYLTAVCPAGKVAIGGGVLNPDNFVLNTGAGTHTVVQIAGGYPNAAFGFSDREWVIQIVPLYGINPAKVIKTVAICAKVN